MTVLGLNWLCSRGMRKVVNLSHRQRKEGVAFCPPDLCCYCCWYYFHHSGCCLKQENNGGSWKWGRCLQFSALLHFMSAHAKWFLCLSEGVCVVQWLATNGFRTNVGCVALHLFFICCYMKKHVEKVPQLTCLSVMDLQCSPGLLGPRGKIW